MTDPGRSLLSSAGSTPSAVRVSNLALILRTVTESAQPLSRSEVATRLRLTRPTVSRLVDELIAGRLLTEGEPVSGPRGRPGIPLSWAAGGLMTLGMEVNADRIAVMVVDLTGEVVSSRTTMLDVRAMGPADALGKLARHARRLIADLHGDARLVGAHLAIPGLMDRTGETIIRAPNLGWDGIRPADYLFLLLEGQHWRFRVSNDVDCSALTVLREASAQVREGGSFIYITGEVGIGSSVINDGRQLSGRHGWASELGHVCVVSAGGKRCACGATGCLETVVGRQALLSETGATSMADLLHLLTNRNPDALAAISVAARALGRALSAALNLLDIQQIVLGGHLETLAPWILPDLKDELSVRVLWSSVADIAISTVKHDPTRTALGAACAALAPLVADPAAWLDTHH